MRSSRDTAPLIMDNIIHELMDSLIPRHHRANFNISESKVSESKLESCVNNMFVSSTKRIKSTTFDTLQRFYIESRKSREPSIEP